ncbi:MAG: hypothetical protein AB1646_16465 [Thermodesulfobacteriota bacterium]
MKPRLMLVLLSLVALFVVVGAPSAAEKDYEDRFMRSYPPGYHGMWYKADRFWEDISTERELGEYYRWDKYMSALTGMTFPFNPAPFDWEYGAGRKFNLPDPNANDWR